MTRQLKLAALTLLALGIGALRCAAAPLPTLSPAQPVAYVVETRDSLAPASVGARPFGGNTPLGMDVLNQHAEVLFDD